MSNILSRMSKDSYFRMGYMYQVSGDLAAAADCYLRSIQKKPSAEAHTFLGWVMSMMGEVDVAIAECRKALRLDPEFGNALNDMGAYLTEKHQFDKAENYLRKASKCKNYESREYPHYNLARIYVHKGFLITARKELDKALKKNPNFQAAKQMVTQLDNLLN